MTEQRKITKDDLEKVQKLMRQIPFGNSAFQIVNFVAKEHNPERGLRKVLLEMQTKIVALEEAQIRRKRLDVDLREIEHKLKKAKRFDRERLEIDREERLMRVGYEDKLIEDAMIEVGIYFSLYEQLPAITREQFELAEQTYWPARLLHEARLQIKQFGAVEKGTLDSLERIGIETSKEADGIKFLEIRREEKK